MTDKVRETIADIVKGGMCWIGCQKNAPVTADAILAALPDIIRQNPSIIADMVPGLAVVGVELAIKELGKQKIAGPFYDRGKDDDWRFRAKLARKEQTDTDTCILRLLVDDIEDGSRSSELTITLSALGMKETGNGV